MYKIDCEYPIGQETRVFTTLSVARSYARSVLSSLYPSDPLYDVHTLEEDGLLTYDKLEIISSN